MLSVAALDFANRGGGHGGRELWQMDQLDV